VFSYILLALSYFSFQCRCMLYLDSSYKTGMGFEKLISFPYSVHIRLLFAVFYVLPQLKKCSSFKLKCFFIFWITYIAVLSSNGFNFHRTLSPSKRHYFLNHIYSFIIFLCDLPLFSFTVFRTAANLCFIVFGQYWSICLLEWWSMYLPLALSLTMCFMLRMPTPFFPVVEDRRYFWIIW
jgi:hypothetical protein